MGTSRRRARKRPRTRSSSADRTGPSNEAAPRAALAPEWLRWIADNLLAGNPPSDIARALVEQGVPSELARREVSAQATSPLLARARLAERRLAMNARLHRALADSSTAEIPRVASLDADGFFRDYYALNRPVVLTDWVRRWPAFGAWTLASFRERLGDEEVTVSVGRDGDPDYDMNAARLEGSMRMSELVDRIEETDASNDFYMIARNRNLARPAFRALLDDVALDPDIFDASQFFGGAQLWVGPAGTVTPLHHDTSNILFCQVFGRKRLTLIPRWETSLVETARELYATFDPEAPDFDVHPGLTPERVHTVELEAGDALFIPVGWWHHVRALSASISLACVNFRRGNAFRWYRPNRPLDPPR